MGGFKSKVIKEEDKLSEEKRKMKTICPNCQHRIHFYAYEHKERQLCRYCGHYVFKDYKEEFKYRLKEKGVKCI